MWDFADSLVVFGGLSESAVLSDVYVLSLSSGFWTRKLCMGQAPSMRYGHSAVMIACNLMLVFGGCNGQVRSHVHPELPAVATLLTATEATS